MTSPFAAAYRMIAAAFFGAGLASVAQAAMVATPAFGPPAIIAFGIEVPILSAFFGMIGVLLARRVAPASATAAKLGRSGNAALTLLLMMGVLAFVITGEKRPIVALAWAIGLGFSGLGFVELVARGVMATIRVVMDGVAGAIMKSAGEWLANKGGDK